MEATNASKMKDRNQKMILNIIRQKEISRAELAHQTGLTKAAISIIIDDLVKSGIVTEYESDVHQVGRKPILLALNKNAFYFIGIDLNRLHFTVGIVNLAGEIISQERYEGKADPGFFYERVEQMLSKQISTNGIDTSKIVSVGVSTPGPMDSQSRMILQPTRFKPWHNVKIGEDLEKRLGYPVYVENISNADALSERYFGAAGKYSSFISVRIDKTGVGSGIVVRGRVFKGINEIGHTSINPYGKKCGCGNTGCLEKYAAIAELLEGTGYTSWEEASKDKIVVAKEAEYLGIALSNACNLFNFEAITLTGEVRTRPKELINKLTKELKPKLLSKKPIDILISRNESTVLNAAVLSMHHFFY